VGEKWGQNFLVSTTYARRIAAQAEGAPRVLEIGPGRGILTAELLQLGSQVAAVEIDPDLCTLLRRRIPDERLALFNEDILEIDFDSIGAGPFFVIGNIPYQITSPIISRLFRERRRWNGIGLLVQKEVATRMCAGPGSRDYSALSVMVATFAHASGLFSVHRTHFQPRPRVDSAFVTLTLLRQPHVEAEAAYPHFLKMLFSQRRKKLSNSLAQFFQGESPGSAYEWLGLDQRIESVSVEQIARLYEQVIRDSRYAESA